MAGQAGWYRAPGEDGLLRYWNGTAWTEHRQPAPVTEPAVAAVSAVQPPLVGAPVVAESISLPTTPTPTIEIPLTQRHVATEPLAPQPTAVTAPAEPDWSMDQFEKQFEEHFGPSSTAHTPDASVSADSGSSSDASSFSASDFTAPSSLDSALRFAPRSTAPEQVQSASVAIALPAASAAPSATPQRPSAVDTAFAASTVTANVARVRRNRKRVLNPVRGMVVGLLFVLVGGALIFFAAVQNNPPAGELRANGIITSLGSPGIGCSPIARFAAEGGSYTTPKTGAIAPCPAELGQSVNVFYKAAHPATSGQIATQSPISTIDWAVAGIGVVLLIGSFILFITRAGSVSRGVAVIRDGELDEVAAGQNRP